MPTETMVRVGSADAVPDSEPTRPPGAHLSPEAAATIATGVAAVLAFGLLGALAMLPPFRRLRRRRANACTVCRGHQRRWLGLTLALAIVTLTGVGLRLAPGEGALPACAVTTISGSAPLGEVHRQEELGRRSRARSVLTAPASGLAIGYSQWRGQTLCDMGHPSMTLTFVPKSRSTSGSTVGDVFLTPPRTDLNLRQTEALARHEARHSDQWAVATALGGVALLPVAYLFDESLYPGSHNHFEQSAGLAAGGYPVEPGPAPGPRPWGVAAWALLAGVLLRDRLRQLARSLTGRSVAPSPGRCARHPGPSELPPATTAHSARFMLAEGPSQSNTRSQ